MMSNEPTAEELAEALESRAKTCLYEGHPSWNHDHCPGPECPHCERDRQTAKMLRELRAKLDRITVPLECAACCRLREALSDE